METSNLLAKPAVVGSVVSVQNGEDGFARAAGFGLGGGDVVQPRRAVRLCAGQDVSGGKKREQQTGRRPSRHAAASRPSLE
jgi:hypothetical protein